MVLKKSGWWQLWYRSSFLHCSYSCTYVSLFVCTLLNLGSCNWDIFELVNACNVLKLVQRQNYILLKTHFFYFWYSPYLNVIHHVLIMHSKFGKNYNKNLIILIKKLLVNYVNKDYSFYHEVVVFSEKGSVEICDRFELKIFILSLKYKITFHCIY